MILTAGAFGAYPDRTYVKPPVYRPTDWLLVAPFVLLQVALIVEERVL